MIKSVLGCINKNTKDRMNSSSGGLFALIADAVLEKGGVVFAVKYDSEWNPVHYEINSKKALEEAMGSKYAQSKLGETFSRILELVTRNTETLFVGTPCQCAGLLSFLGKRYDCLITIDLFCHGVPSPLAWRAYLNTLDNRSITSINMRDKSSGWSNYNYSWKIDYDNGDSQIIKQNDVSFMTGFVNNLYLRPSCYSCRFKGVDRDTDITIGDYWGVWKYQSNMDDNKGTSVAIIRTERGLEIIKNIDQSLISEEARIEDVIKHNPSLIESPLLTESRKIFFERLSNDEDINIIIDDLVKKKDYTMLERIKTIVRNFI